MPDFNQQEIGSLVKELRDTIESKKAETSDSKEKIAKIDEKLNAQEDANQKLVAEINERKANEFKAEEKYKDLERQVYMMPNSLSKDQKSEEMKVFEHFITTGQKEIIQAGAETKYLRTDVDTQGGYLAPVEYVKEILKNITEISPIRSVARVRSAAGKASEMPIRTTLVSGNWVGQGETDTRSNSTYGLKYMPMHKIQVTVPVTIEELQDADFDITTEINADVAEKFSQIEGTAFVNGTGSDEPIGFMYASGIASINSGLAAAFTMDNIIELSGELKTGYNPMYGFNRTTRAYIQQFKGNDQYFWQAGNLAAGVPNTINGYTYLEIPDMDNVGANNFPVVFADFMRGYLIGDRMGMSVIRDDYSRKRESIVEFTFLKRTTGKPVLDEAFVKLKCSL